MKLSMDSCLGMNQFTLCAFCVVSLLNSKKPYKRLDPLVLRTVSDQNLLIHNLLCQNLLNENLLSQNFLLLNKGIGFKV